MDLWTLLSSKLLSQCFLAQQMPPALTMLQMPKPRLSSWTLWDRSCLTPSVLNSECSSSWLSHKSINLSPKDFSLHLLACLVRCPLKTDLPSFLQHPYPSTLLLPEWNKSQYIPLYWLNCIMASHFCWSLTYLLKFTIPYTNRTNSLFPFLWPFDLHFVLFLIDFIFRAFL